MAKIARVQLPEGCYGLDLADGTKYTGKPGTKIEVSEDHARQINRSWYGSTGVMRGEEHLAIGTKRARVCTHCVPTRRWNAWNDTCQRCGESTIEETK